MTAPSPQAGRPRAGDRGEPQGVRSPPWPVPPCLPPSWIPWREPKGADEGGGTPCSPSGPDGPTSTSRPVEGETSSSTIMGCWATRPREGTESAPVGLGVPSPPLSTDEGMAALPCASASSLRGEGVRSKEGVEDPPDPARDSGVKKARGLPSPGHSSIGQRRCLLGWSIGLAPTADPLTTPLTPNTTPDCHPLRWSSPWAGAATLTLMGPKGAR